MTVSKKKTKRVSKDPLTLAEWREVEQLGSYANDKILAKLTPAERREIEREAYEPSLSRRLRDVLGDDPSSGGKYFMNQMDRLRTLAGALAPLMQERVVPRPTSEATLQATPLRSTAAKNSSNVVQSTSRRYVRASRTLRTRASP